jgi:peptide/nickel transport system substrate-binding protein
MPRRSLLTLTLLILLLAACTPSAPAGGGGDAANRATEAGRARTLRMMVRNEVDNLQPKVTGPNAPERTRRLFNAELTLMDRAGNAIPYLAETLPQLNTDNWQLLPDGRMVTTYRLRPGLTWQDGAPLTAEDFVFGWRVYTSPTLGIFSNKPQDLIEEIAAPDPRTLVIRWSTTYPDAGTLAYDQLPPLPQHILEGAFTAGERDPAARDTILNHSYWTNEYVGAGPFRLVRWDAGYELEGVAFDGHALGRAKIDRIFVRIMNDENAALTRLLAGEADYAEGFLLQFEHGVILQREWEPTRKGTVLIWPDATSAQAVQFRPEFQKSPPLFDVRVRRAISHAVDRQAVDEGTFDGKAGVLETYVTPQAPYYAEVDRTITKYPYDPRRTEQLMNEAGLSKDGEGFFARGGERFRPDYWITAGTQSERASAIISESWRRAGVDNQPFVLSLAAGRDNEVRATFPGMTQVGMGVRPEVIENMLSSQIGTPANRWRGNNRGGWVSPEVDRLWEAYNSTLDRSERDRRIIEIAKVASDQLPIFVLYPNIRVRAVAANLTGPDVGAPGTLPQWDVHTWELR